MLKQFIEIPYDLWKGIYQTGSSVICDPPVLDLDIDFVVYTTKTEKLLKFLEDNNFTSSNSEDYSINSDGLFTSLRRDKINLIVVSDVNFYQRWVEATILAKRLNLKEKQQRVDLFSCILYSIK